VLGTGLKSQLDLVVTSVAKDVVKFARYLSSGKDYGVRVVAID
jgi:hypothetical protein